MPLLQASALHPKQKGRETKRLSLFKALLFVSAKRKKLPSRFLMFHCIDLDYMTMPRTIAGQEGRNYYSGLDQPEAEKSETNLMLSMR